MLVAKKSTSIKILIIAFKLQGFFEELFSLKVALEEQTPK